MKIISILALAAATAAASPAMAWANLADLGKNFESCYNAQAAELGVDVCNLGVGGSCSDRLASLVSQCAGASREFELINQQDLLAQAEKGARKAGQKAQDGLSKVLKARKEYLAAVKKLYGMLVEDKDIAQAEYDIFELTQTIRFNYFLGSYFNCARDPECEPATGENPNPEAEAANWEKVSYHQDAYPGYEKCRNKATAMTDMYDCQDKGLKLQDGNLNKIYKKIMGSLGDKKKKDLKDAVRDMERKWIKYKEAVPAFMLALEEGSVMNLDAREFTLEDTMIQNQLLEKVASYASRR